MQPSCYRPRPADPLGPPPGIGLSSADPSVRCFLLHRFAGVLYLFTGSLNHFTGLGNGLIRHILSGIGRLARGVGDGFTGFLGRFDGALDGVTRCFCSGLARLYDGFASCGGGFTGSLSGFVRGFLGRFHGRVFLLGAAGDGQRGNGNCQCNLRIHLQYPENSIKTRIRLSTKRAADCCRHPRLLHCRNCRNRTAP